MTRAGGARHPSRLRRRPPGGGAGVSSGRGRLPRSLGPWSAGAAVVGLMIGSGIFRVPSSVAGDVGGVGAIVLVWTLGGVLSLFGALALAELAAMLPRAGGVYVYLREAYGPLAAFLFGWAELVVLRPSSVGAISLVFAAYFGRLVGLGPDSERWIAVGLIAALGALNYRSLVWSARVENAATATKLVALVAIAGLALLLGTRAGGALAAAPALAPSSWSGFGLALVTVMFTYSGWASATALAGEVRDPGRTMPLALAMGVAVVSGAYLLVNAAYLHVLPLTELAASTAVAAEALTRVLGPAGNAAVAAVVAVSTFGALNASLMFGPRVFYAMAEDGLFPSRAAAVHATFGTPHVAVLVTVLLGISYVAVRTFEELARAFVLGAWPFYALAVAGVFVLRRRHPGARRPYRVWGYPVVPAVFVGLSVAMLGNAVLREPALSLFGFGLILVGVPVYLAWTRHRTPIPRA